MILNPRIMNMLIFIDTHMALFWLLPASCFALALGAFILWCRQRRS